MGGLCRGGAQPPHYFRLGGKYDGVVGDVTAPTIRSLHRKLVAWEGDEAQPPVMVTGHAPVVL